MKYMWPKQRFISTPITLPLIDSLEVAREQIAKLASLGMQGEIDLDSMTAISRTIALAAGLRLEELEGFSPTGRPSSEITAACTGAAVPSRR